MGMTDISHGSAYFIELFVCVCVCVCVCGYNDENKIAVCLLNGAFDHVTLDYAFERRILTHRTFDRIPLFKKQTVNMVKIV